MRFFILLFLFGIACAKPLHDALDYEAEKAARDILANLELTPSLEAYFSLAAEGDDDDIKTELGKKLKEHLDDIISKIKDAIDHGKVVKEEYLEKLQELKKKLKEVGVDLGQKLKDRLKDLGQKFKDKLKELLEKLGLKEKEKRSEDTETGKKMREALDNLLEKIKEAIDHGKTVKDDLLNKLKEIREKMKDLHVDLGERAKELLQKIKDHAKDFIRKILEKLGFKDKDEVEQASIFENLREKLTELRDTITGGAGIEKIREKIEEVFGKSSDATEFLFEKLEESFEEAKEEILKLIRRFLGREYNRDERSIAEVWDKVKDYFKNLQIQIKEKFLNFGAWVKEHMGNVLEKGKDKLENIKIIARELRDHAKEISKDVLTQGLEFIQQYKDDLGSLFEEMKKSIKEVLSKQQ